VIESGHHSGSTREVDVGTPRYACVVVGHKAKAMAAAKRAEAADGTLCRTIRLRKKNTINNTFEKGRRRTTGFIVCVTHYKRR
jgi:hypothetical protein